MTGELLILSDSEIIITLTVIVLTFLPSGLDGTVHGSRSALPLETNTYRQNSVPKRMQTVHLCYICVQRSKRLLARPLPSSHLSLLLNAVPRRLKHSVGQQSTTWPQLAAATALAASDTSTVCDPPSSTTFNVFCEPGEAGRSGWSSNLRATLPGEPPLESSPTRRGSRGEGGGWGVEGVGLRPGWQSNGYTSDAALI